MQGHTGGNFQHCGSSLPLEARQQTRLLGLHAGWHLVGVVKECGVLDLLFSLLLASVEAHIEVASGVAEPAANAQAEWCSCLPKPLFHGKAASAAARPAALQWQVYG